ncbi:hypothetical protein B0A49_05138 [Cryomyces minteri]|uniref:rRNA-processing protein FYV7 n=1 Tax=Cryomyces minteri TaxID=331657 RepID=A0A4U0XE27_9PEZI|nr:hypothetical protein B0A49_05138 [Cryomyces minteri]
MSSKRPREDAVDGNDRAKKQRKGFSVGPANLPDGTYKRKVQKIKKDLIHKAKIKKEYAKVKAREQAENPASAPAFSLGTGATEPAAEPTTEPHPERQAAIDDEAANPDPEPAAPSYTSRRISALPQDRKRRPKPVPFAKEASEAQRRKEEAEVRRREREEAARQRQQKIEERERFRRAMAKARTGGKNGQRKLGRESQVLLEKVQRMISGNTNG